MAKDDEVVVDQRIKGVVADRMGKGKVSILCEMGGTHIRQSTAICGGTHLHPFWPENVQRGRRKV